jgi:alpha-1,2-mannosyltransferase
MTRLGLVYRWFVRHPWTVAGVVVLLALAWPSLRAGNAPWPHEYVTAGKHLWYGGDIYDNKYGYPPFMSLVAVPLAWMPPFAARLLWFVVHAGALALLWRLAWRLAGGKCVDGESQGGWREHLILVAGVLCAFRFGTDAIRNFQNDTLIGLLMLGGCALLERTRTIYAAMSFGLAAAMKCTPLLWLPYLLWKRHWLAAAVLLAVAIGVNLLPDLIRAPAQGGTWLGKWMGDLADHAASPHIYPGQWGSAQVLNQSVAGMVNRWFVSAPDAQGTWFHSVQRLDAWSPGELRILVYGSGMMLMAVAGVVLLRCRWLGQRLDDGLECSIILLLMPLLSPMTSKAHLCTLLLPAYVLARLAIVHRSAWAGGCLALAILLNLLSTRDLVGHDMAYWMTWYGACPLSMGCLLAGCLGAALAHAPSAESQSCFSKTTSICTLPRIRVTGSSGMKDRVSFQ